MKLIMGFVYTKRSQTVWKKSPIIMNLRITDK